jgi:ribosomal protein S18 acetylase RimI-like enzyme
MKTISDIKIKAAKKADLVICEKIAKTKELTLYNGTYLTKEYMSHYLNRNYFLVASIQDTIVGFIYGEKIKDSGSLVWIIAVSKEHRGHNIGTFLLNEYERRMKKINIEWVVLYGSKVDDSTINFYKKNKYRSQDKLSYVEFIKEF